MHALRMVGTISAAIVTAKIINVSLQSVAVEDHAGIFMAKAATTLAAAMRCVLSIMTVVNLDGMQHVLH
jgi:hypothetical protein